MGILEVSRAIEDAQYGIRGVLNNIPGIIQSFGGSMGLAGVVSIAAVAVSVFGKSLWDMAMAGDRSAESVEQLKNRTTEYIKALQGVSEKRRQALRDFEENKKALIEEKKLRVFIEGLGDPSGKADKEASHTERMRAVRDRIQALEAEKEAALGFAGATPRRDPAADLEQDYKAAYDLAEKLKRRGLEIEREIFTTKPLVPSAMMETNAELEGEKAIVKAENNLKKLESIKANAEGVLMSSSEIVKDQFTKLFRARADSDDPLSPLQFAPSTRDEARATLYDTNKQIEEEKKKLQAIKDQVRAKKQENDITKKHLDALQKEADDNKTAVSTAIEKRKQAELELETRRKELKLQKEIAALGYGSTGLRGIPVLGDVFAAMNDAKNGFAEIVGNSMMGNLSGFRINPSDMLSSSGRIGGSVSEYNSAVATVNYQRETLAQLKKIATNTGRKGVATFF
jgi:hypothetical protein